MDDITSRDRILNLIKTSFNEKEVNNIPVDKDYQDLFVREEGMDIELFERKFTALQGRFHKSIGRPDFADCLAKMPVSWLSLKWHCVLPELRPTLASLGIETVDEVLQAEVALTGCECFIARTGSFVLSAAQTAGRALSVYAPVHIVVGKADQLVYDTGDAISFMLNKYGTNLPSSIYFVAGPSRTGDIEKTLVLGVHGPKEVCVILIDQFP